MNADQFHLWKTLLITAETISDVADKKKMNKQDLIFQLNSIEEVFGKSIDPTEDFQGYVVLQLCKSLKKSLQNF